MSDMFSHSLCVCDIWGSETKVLGWIVLDLVQQLIPFVLDVMPSFFTKTATHVAKAKERSVHNEKLRWLPQNCAYQSCRQWNGSSLALQSLRPQYASVVCEMVHVLDQYENLTTALAWIHAKNCNYSFVRDFAVLLLEEAGLGAERMLRWGEDKGKLVSSWLGRLRFFSKRLSPKWNRALTTPPKPNDSTIRSHTAVS